MFLRAVVEVSTEQYMYVEKGVTTIKQSCKLTAEIDVSRRACPEHNTNNKKHFEIHFC